MVGFPGEPEDEADKIMSLARELSLLKKTVSKGAAEIKISVNPFIPKSHTPLQWIGMKQKEALQEVKNALYSRATRKIKVEFHDLKQSVLEASMSRGDRKIGDVVLSAFRKGATMDSWSDFFNFSIWEEAFSENGLSMEEYAYKTYSFNEVLPWSHIKTGVRDEYFKEELEESGLYDRAK